MTLPENRGAVRGMKVAAGKAVKQAWRRHATPDDAALAGLDAAATVGAQWGLKEEEDFPPQVGDLIVACVVDLYILPKNWLPTITEPRENGGA